MSASASPLAAHASNAFATRHGAVNRPLWLWLCIGVLGYLALPWYAQQDTNGLLAVGQVFSSEQAANGLMQAVAFGRPWLWLGLIGLAVAGAASLMPAGRRQGAVLLLGGAATATLTFASLVSTSVGGGSVLRFSSSQTFNNSTNKVTFGTTAPTLTNGLIQRAVITDASGTNFATFNGVVTTGNLQAFSAYTVSDGSGVGTDVTFTNVNGGTAYGLNASAVAGVFSTAPTYRVTADTALYSVFRRPDGRKTYLAYNATKAPISVKAASSASW